MGEHRIRFRFLYVVLLFLLGVVVTAGYIVYVAVTLRPGASVNYAQEFYDHVEARQPAGEDAWSRYEALHAAHQRLKERIRAEAPTLEKFVHPDYTSIFTDYSEYSVTGDEAVNQLNAEEAALHEAESATAREWAKKSLDGFAEAGIDEGLDHLVSARRMVRPPSNASLLLDTLLPDLGSSRDLARAHKARMRLAIEAGDQRAFVQYFERTSALARHIAAQGTLIERLVGTAILALCLGEAEYQCVHGGLSAETCRELLDAIERQGEFPPPSFHVEGERMIMLDYLQKIHSDDGNGDGVRIVTESRRLADQAPGPRIINVAGVLLPSKKEMVAAANGVYDGLARAADTPRRENRSSVFDYHAHIAALGPKFEILGKFGAAYGKAFAANDQVLMNTAGVRILLAIEIFRAQHGKPPASLHELAPAILPALPEDPYSDDGAFGYAVLDAPDSRGRTFLLYSVGADGKDDGGKPAKIRYDALRHPAGEGTDFIINEGE